MNLFFVQIIRDGEPPRTINNVTSFTAMGSAVHIIHELGDERVIVNSRVRFEIGKQL